MSDKNRKREKSTASLSECVSVEVAAKKLGYTTSATCLLCRQGKMSGAYKEGREWRIPVTSLNEYVPLPKGFSGAAAAKKLKNERRRNYAKSVSDFGLVETMGRLSESAQLAVAILRSHKENNTNLVDENENGKVRCECLLVSMGFLCILDELDRTASAVSDMLKRRFRKLKTALFRPLRDRMLHYDGTADEEQILKMMEPKGLLRKRMDFIDSLVRIILKT